MSTNKTHSPERQRTNATYRLSAVLDTLAHNNMQAAVADVLATVLGIKDSDPNRSFLLAITAITKMLESSQKEVETYLSSEASFYEGHFRTLRVCFSPKTSAQPWNSHKPQLTAGDIIGIRHTAQRLKTLVPECEATDTDFADVLASIEQMSQALDSEGLSKHSRDVLRNCLNEIKKALDEYRIWGADGLDRACKVFVGTLAVDQVVLEELRATRKDGHSVWDKAVKVANGLLLLINLVTGAYNLEQKLLPTLDKLMLANTTSLDTVAKTSLHSK